MMQNNFYHKGDIVLIPFPFTIESEEVRPAVILAASEKGEDATVVFISSFKPKHSPTDPIHVPYSPETGLKVESWIYSHKLATLLTTSIVGKIGVLPPLLQTQLDLSLHTLLAL